MPLTQVPMADTRRCVFCGHRVNSREHVWPEWLSKVVPGPRGAWKVTQTHEHAPGEIAAEREFEQKPFRQKVGCVCKGCNNGWMSELETAAAPFLTPLIQGRGKQLHAEGQRLISAWALLRALIVSRTSIELTPIPATHYRWLYEHREAQSITPPPNSLVRLGRFQFGEQGPLYRDHALKFELPGRPVAEPNAYTATFTVGYLAIQLLGSIWEEELHVHPTSDIAAASLRIWPHARSVTWPPRDTFTPRGLRALADSFLSRD